MNKSKCPICDSNGGFRDYLTWGQSSWVRCRACGGGHQEPYIPEVDKVGFEAEHYGAPYFDADFYERRQRFAANQARWLMEHHRAGMAVLEVGPGLGLAAQRFLQDAPKGTPYHVVEPHPVFARYITDQQADGVVVHSGDPAVALREAMAATCESRRPVLFYMDNVLEHVAGPREYLLSLKQTLPPGSVALIDVPNERGLKTRCKIYRSIGAQPTAAADHINLFTPRAFHCMLGSLGLRHRVRQRGIRRPEEVNCIPEGAALTAVLGLLRVVPLDRMLGLANNLRVEVAF